MRHRDRNGVHAPRGFGVAVLRDELAAEAEAGLEYGHTVSTRGTAESAQAEQADPS
jgi:hypothetical protein